MEPLKALLQSQYYLKVRHAAQRSACRRISETIAVSSTIQQGTIVEAVIHAAPRIFIMFVR
jgi:hypothetical protein